MESLIQVSGMAPGLSVSAESLPRRSECGIGALIVWARRLWFLTCVSHKVGAGTGLYEVDEKMVLRKRPESVVGTFGNRMIHSQSNQFIIGPHLISSDGVVRTVDTLAKYRLAGVAEHLTDPVNWVYVLGMEGQLWEMNVRTLEVRELFDLNRELELPHGAQPHYKAAFTAFGRLIVANNTYDENDFAGRRAGRLAEWDGRAWNIVERSAFNEIHGRKTAGCAVFATGWDRASAILRVCINGKWTRYRLPKASQCHDHYWQPEWPRIREVMHARLLMDCQGMFYELSPFCFDGGVWGVKPICVHLEVVPDFCCYKGMLVMGTNQMTPSNDANLLAGEPQSGLWLGKIDDLWQRGKPSGWGGPWWEKAVQPGAPSDPYLMTGFEHKCLHLCHNSGDKVRFNVEVDFLGNGSWETYHSFLVRPGGYMHHVFPTGFGAHWVRVTALDQCAATAYFTYT